MVSVRRAYSKRNIACCAKFSAIKSFFEIVAPFQFFGSVVTGISSLVVLESEWVKTDTHTIKM